MVIDINSKNRCAIFLFYDRDGIVDDYITYMLEDLKESLDFLLVVCNGAPTDDAVKKLESVADEVYIRENSGFDVGGYRDGLFHLGWDKLTSYDEVIMLNYTFFGALYPFKEAFDAMAERDVDFWGLTKHHKVPYDPFGHISYGYIPEHIQSHFLVLRRDFVASSDYQDFMTNMENPKSYIESICDYEAVFTKKFEDMGYKWDVYDNTSRFEDYTYSPVMFYIKDMLEHDRCPIIKRRSFFTDYNDYMLNSCGESSVDAYEYIRENIDYDVNMIWDNILRLENMSEVSKVMQLNYCNATDMAYTERKLEDLTVAVWVKSVENIEFYHNFLSQLSDEYRLVFVGSEKNTDFISKYMKNNFKLSSTFCVVESLDTVQQFVACVRENTDTTYVTVALMDDRGSVKPYSNKISNIYKDWSCLLSSRDYIANMLSDFDDNERMGIGIPPVPDFGEYFAGMTDGWMGRYEDVKEYLSGINVRPNINMDIEPLVPVGGNFIIKTSVLKNEIFGNAIKEAVDDDVFLLALVELVRASGYYTGIVYSNDYAAVELTNSDYMLRELNKAVFYAYGPNFYSVVRDRVDNNERQDMGNQIAHQVTWKTKVKGVARRVMPQRLYNIARDTYRKLRG